MQAEIKQYREKGKRSRATNELCGKLILTADHRLDGMLLTLLWRALFPLGKRRNSHTAGKSLLGGCLIALKSTAPRRRSSGSI